MRILLASNALYFPAHGGGERSNRLLLEALAEQGHKCHVVSRVDRFDGHAKRQLADELGQRGLDFEDRQDRITFVLRGVHVTVATLISNFRDFFVEQQNTIRPDVILTSTDDPAQLLLEAALASEQARTVFLARATVALPFGPDAAFPSASKTRVLAQADAIVGVSHFVASYIQRHSGIDAVHVPIALPDAEVDRPVGRYDNEFVTMVNPCGLKGISIFIALAQAMPDLSFAAVPTWGTTHEDRQALNALANVTVLARVDRVLELLARTRVLVVPSLWAEARSRIVVEAMLAGVPVVASDLGGLPEAKMGVPYLVPVRPITKYKNSVDEQMVPQAEIPEQDVEPWIGALRKLTSDRDHWATIAGQSRAAATKYADETNVEPFESLLLKLKRKTRAGAPAAIHLTPERQRLLALTLRKQALSSAATSLVLPFGEPPPDALRVFCFPHAGASAGSYRSLRTALSAECSEQGRAVELAPVQYPGRNNRSKEQFASTMSELVGVLANDLAPHLVGAFVFLGHSMGAIVAFELIRLLREQGKPLPVSLIASGARAPDFRLNHRPPPDPLREELIAEVKRLGAWQSGNEEALPILEADTALYRRYIYYPGLPLPVPILAIGGQNDANVLNNHLDIWKGQTSSEFALNTLPGGHFYFQSQQAEMAKLICEFIRNQTVESRSDDIG